MYGFFSPLKKIKKRKIHNFLEKGKKLFDEKRYVQSYHCFLRAAALKSPEAQYQLGLCCLGGHGVAFSLQEAFLWFESAAQSGYSDAEYMLALLYMRGLPDIKHVTGQDLFQIHQEQSSHHLKTDLKKACYWAKKVAEQGHADGEALYAYLLSEMSTDQNQLDEIFEWYDKSIAQGSPQGYMGKGLLLLKYSNTDEDYKIVATLLEVAAKKGLGMAIYTLGIMYEAGKGVDVDHVHAVALYKQAAELGVRQAQALYGVSLRKGNGVEQNLLEAETWLRRAAIGGDVEAASVLADMLVSGSEEAPPKYSEAMKWYQFAFEKKEHIGAAFALGYLYLNGLGVVRSVEKAIQFYKFSASKGYVPALDALLDMAFSNFGNISIDEMIRDYLRPEAEKGNKQIMRQLAIALLKSDSLNADSEKEIEAQKWLKACCDEDMIAQYWYGRMVLQGGVGHKNLKEACKWIKSSAEQGYVKAELLWASLLLEGKTDEGKICVQEALDFFNKAAKQGNASGMFSLGAIYGGGNHLKENRVEAQKWFLKAAELGHSKAQLMLGRYLLNGLAGTKDVKKAHYWFEQALQNGEKEAEQELAALDSNYNNPENDQNFQVEALKKSDQSKDQRIEIAPGLFIFNH